MMRIVLWCCLSLWSVVAWADVLTLKESHPQTYVVKKGDTLWDISALFLKSPWRWPELWQINPQIADPHWIYPGDTLSLIFIDGQPRLVIGQRAKQQLKASPRGRKTLKNGPIPTIPLSAISQYLSHRKVLLADELDGTPMITGGERKAIFYAKRDVVFVNAELPKGALYGVYRDGRQLVDPNTGEFLGQEIELVAAGRIIDSDAISRLALVSSEMEVRPGYRLLLLDTDDHLPAYFMPQAAPAPTLGQIIALDGDVREVGRNAVVVLNIGAEQGAAPGQVLSAYHPGAVMVSSAQGIPKYPEDLGAYDNLMSYFVAENSIVQPDVFRGNVMIFNVFDKVSYAIISELARPVRVEDIVSNP